MRLASARSSRYELIHRMNDTLPITRALISVSKKEGLIELCQALSTHKVELLASGGTAEYLKKAGFSVLAVESVTHFPEIMEGRVKTLHPSIFGGILARRENSTDLSQALTHHIPLIDLVVVNLYPFEEHLSDTTDTQTGFVDIGGPSLLRAASKNFRSVTVLSSPQDYPAFIQEWNQSAGKTSLAFRKAQAAKTFDRTSCYDAMIASAWLGEAPTLPNPLTGGLGQTSKKLRYGENPHQEALWFDTELSDWKVTQGKELSYNNLLDADSAVGLVTEMNLPAVAIIKHNNPCGVAWGNSPAQDLIGLFNRALGADEISAFGGIVALNREVDAPSAQRMADIFLEVIIAPQFTEEAHQILGRKKNLRLIEWKNPRFQLYEVRTALGGWLLQHRDDASEGTGWKEVTSTKIDPALKGDLLHAWKVAKFCRSNAIVIAQNGRTIGLGAGQTSRVDAVKIAVEKAAAHATSSSPSRVLASDAFFPFRDNIDLLKGQGIHAIIQPGGSQRDPEVIAACNELGIAMVFTGTRHFRH